MEFEWDDEKAALNEQKHGIPFPFAIGVFLDDDRLEWFETRGDYDELRWVTIGLVDGIEIAVVDTMRGQTVRLISARKAERHEREDYWNS
jgi:uncharacterized DUF497 family protein